MNKTKKIDIPIGGVYTTDLGITITPVEYSKEFIRAIENEEKTACDDCALNKRECDNYACCFEERKDGVPVYFAKIK